MAPRSRSRIRRQVRGFVAAWTFITFVVSLATFLAIYFAYPSVEAGALSSQDVAIPLGDGTAVAGSVVVLPSITPQPTNPPTNTPEIIPTATQLPPTQAEQSVAQVVEPTDIPPTQPPTNTPEPTATLTPLPVEDESFQVGIQVQYSLDLNPDNQDGYFRSVREDLGLRWVKQQVRWEDVEKEPGVYDWSKLDLVMPSAQRFGINIMMSIVTAPDWAREPGVSTAQHGPPADYQDYVNFVLAILDRYPGQVQAIEVWNEQNLSREWTSLQGIRADRYVELLRITSEAVKAVDPGIIIISGALAPTGIDDGIGAVNDFRYMELMINAGMLNYADCVGAHHNGYNIGPSIRWDAVPNDPFAIFRGPFDNPHHSWSFRSTLEGYATRIARAGSDTKLCVTEFGWPVSEDLEGYPRGFEFAADNSLEEQAEYFPQALSLMEEWDTVWLAFIWNFNYAPQAGWDPNNDNVPYSLIGPGFSFRPAYDAIREWQASYRERTGRS